MDEDITWEAFEFTPEMDGTTSDAVNDGYMAATAEKGPQIQNPAPKRSRNEPKAIGGSHDLGLQNQPDAMNIPQANARLRAGRPQPGSFFIPWKAGRTVDELHAWNVNVIVASNPATKTLNAIDVGTDYFNRQGRVIRIVSLHVHGIVRMQYGASANWGAAIRVIVWIWHFRKVADPLPVETDLLQDNTNTLTKYLSATKLDNRQNLTILHDEYIDVPAIFANDPNFKQVARNYEFNIYKKLNLKTVYNAAGTTNDAHDISENSINITFIRAQDPISYDVTALSRVRFYTD